MVGNDISLSRPVSRRKVSSAATASISVSLPRGASRSNQARKLATAAPSRTCAARAPAISAAFFTAFISAIGSAPRATLPPGSDDEARERIGGGRLVEPHGLARLPSAVSACTKCAGLAHVGERFEIVAHLVRELAAVDVERGPPFCGTIAKASGSGVCATSAPRMLKAQATACGSETTSASARASRSRPACARAFPRPPRRRIAGHAA